ncbi:MAG: membrane protein insertion efficiency factor YidD, partial [Desulfobacteraceae bacterium]
MNPSIKMLAVLCFVFLLVTSGHTPGICAGDDISRPSESPSSEESSGFNPAQWLLSMYKHHISPVNADQCPSYPSCSSYAEQAMRKHGFFIGWMMSVDRLIHEGREETVVSPYIHFDGEDLIL